MLSDLNHFSQAMAGASLLSCPSIDLEVSSPLTTYQKQQANDAFKNAKIMVVDDDSVILKMLDKHLSDADFDNVITTDDSATAFELIYEERPDILLLDIRMAVSGFQLLELIKGEEELKSIPVVVLTSSTDEDTKLKALHLGANDFLTKPVNVGELLVRVRNNLTVKAHCDHLARYTQQLEREVYFDALTETKNRRAFDKELLSLLRGWNVDKRPLSLLLVDIDHFKKVNDCFGHRAGDNVLRALARVLRDELGPEDVLCRYGGEELSILLPGVAAEAAQAIADRIRTSVQHYRFNFEELQLQLTVSVGATTAIQRDNSATLFQRADSALYASKQSGRNCCHFNDGNTCALTGGASDECVHESEFNSDFDKPTNGELSHAKIMIVDDEPVMILTVKKHLKDGGFCNFVTCNDSTKAMDMVRLEQPDIVLLDVRMPEICGIEILGNIRADEIFQHIPVVVLTSTTDENTKLDALELGACDFLSKPVKPSELLPRVRNTLMLKAQHDRLAHYSQQLEFEINRRTAELFSSRSEVIHCLASAAECRDDQTGHHIVRVGMYTTVIAREMEYDEEQIPSLESAVQLHDVGKIGISDAILRKKGALTAEEREVMKRHSEIGVKILKECNTPVMRLAADIAATHHEMWDGTGYPLGLAGEDIPLAGRMTAVADVFDALSNKRYYKDAFDLEECFKLIEAGSGSHFDPAVVRAFLARKEEILSIYHDYADQQIEDSTGGAH